MISKRLFFLTDNVLNVSLPSSNRCLFSNYYHIWLLEYLDKVPLSVISLDLERSDELTNTKFVKL